ncbi:hypothetical protein B2J88_47930 [Rhodococcus sp. SRB_17]|nr:hypothetical protein [Rhodococcus sp. SRB_17]
MSRSNPDRCHDIIEAIGKIERYQTKLSGPDVEMAYDAIVRQLGIIGEAAKSLDSDSKATAPEIEWHKIVGLRNVAIHEYFRLNSSIVHGVVANFLPDLKKAVERIAQQIS